MKRHLFRMFSIALCCIGFAISGEAQAATTTVCASGCDYTTITDAITGGLGTGDVIAVGATYASTTETFSFNLPTGVTLDCQNSGAIIGTDDENNTAYINSQSENIFRNCTFSNVRIQNTNQSNVQILDNTWRGNSSITSNDASEIIISRNTSTGNKGLQSISLANTSSSVISSNTIMSYAGNSSVPAIRLDHATSIQITNNIIQDNTTTTNNNYDVISFVNYSIDIYFASNTVSEPFLTTFGGGMSVIQLSANDATIADNTFFMNGSGGGIGVNLNANLQSVSAEVRHNTFVLGSLCTQCNIVQPGAFTSYNIYVTSTYNLFVSFASSSANNNAHNVSGAGPSANLSAFSEYEGIVGLNATNDSANFPIGANAIIRTYNPLMTDDGSSANDYEQAPWSAFLDVNGTLDVGARAGVRGNNFQINASGTIDYSAVHATNTSAVIDHVRSNDTVNLASGNYAPIVLIATSTNVPLLSGISIIGAGSNTIIHASSTGNALLIDGITDSTFSNFMVTGASSTVTSTYSITRSQFSAGATDYDDGAGIGFPNAIIIAGGIPSGGSCNASLYNADGFNVTTLVGGASDDWNLFLIDYLGNKLTLLAPDRFVPDAVTALGCANPGQITVEHEVSSIYTVSSGAYTYNSTAAALAGVSPKAGETNPPRLDRAIIGGTEAGIALLDASTNTITNVTSTGNSAGISFSGTASGNSITDSDIDTNSNHDIYDTSSGVNSLVDSFFDIGDVSMSGNGQLKAYFSARVLTQNSSLMGISGMTVNGESANAASSTSLVSGGSGFSAFNNPLPAFTLTSSSLTLTSGSFNPYTWISAANSSYNSASITASLNQPKQTITLTLTAAASGGGGGSGGSVIYPIVPNPQSTDGLAERLAALALLGLSPGDLVKLPNDGNNLSQEDSTVYEIGADGRRHAFPNPSVYFSRYCSFGNIKILSGGSLARLPLGANMTYYPGLRLVKFVTVPTVYLVQGPNILRAIPNETMAAQLAGPDWNKRVSDISDAFYLDYVIGAPVDSFVETLDRTPPLVCAN